jgi:hypothetical protein
VVTEEGKPGKLALRVRDAMREASSGGRGLETLAPELDDDGVLVR